MQSLVAIPFESSSPRKKTGREDGLRTGENLSRDVIMADRVNMYCQFLAVNSGFFGSFVQIYLEVIQVVSCEDFSLP